MVENNKKININKHVEYNKAKFIICNRGITTITLIITIIILIILAGIVINLSIGENGLFNKAKYAKEKYINEQIREEEEIATTSNEIDKYLTDSSQNKSSINEPTGLKTDTFLCNKMITSSQYIGITSMTGLDKIKDNANNIDQYLEFSDTKGYKVLKTGWYWVKLHSLSSMGNPGTSNACSTTIRFNLNGIDIQEVRTWICNVGWDDSSDAFSIFLKKDDHIYFSFESHDIRPHIGEGYIFPMF